MVSSDAELYPDRIQTGGRMARTLPRVLAVLVEELELTQPHVVTTGMIRELAALHQVRTEPRVLAARLRERGWLLGTSTRGVWEFAPGSHAGPYGHADPTTPLRAVLANSRDVPAALALATAAWAHGYADRVPSRLDVAIPRGVSAPAGLRAAAAVVVFTSNIGYVRRKGVPTHRPESVLVHLATRPTAVRSWGSVLEWLPDLAADLDVDAVRAELAGRPASVHVRTGYLMAGLRPDIAHLGSPAAGGKVWFGPRGPLLRHSATWQVADTVLPFDPVALPDARTTA